jgi:hypothetical protein
LSSEVLIQLAGSAVAVALLIALAGWARIARPTPPLDEARARSVLAIEFPGAGVDQLWLASDGRSALARSGRLALVLFLVGDGYVARSLPWDQARAVRAQGGRVKLRFPEVAAPRASLAFADWPPGQA